MASLTTIAVYSDLEEAAVAASYLRAYGFVVLLPEWHYVSVLWHHCEAVQGIRLQTISRKAIEARQLLQCSKETSEQPSAHDASARWVRADVSANKLLLAIVAFLYAGLPLPIWKRRWRKEPAGG